MSKIIYSNECGNYNINVGRKYNLLYNSACVRACLHLCICVTKEIISNEKLIALRLSIAKG